MVSEEVNENDQSRSLLMDSIYSGYGNYDSSSAD